MSHKFSYRLASLFMALTIAFAGVTPALAAPPLNDNFADAEAILSVPFSATVDITEGTTESGEPQFCWFMDRTVWYSFTPAQNMVVRASTQGSAIGSNVNIYQSGGFGINNLNFLGCADFDSSVPFFAEAGQTYYLQVGPTFQEGGNIQVGLEEFNPPPPVADFNYSPSDPSSFDDMGFCDQSSDPGNLGFESFTWDFGDGTTSTGNCAFHRYAADGDYIVQHSVTTIDGRTASTSKVVQVRTHDVAIIKVGAPRSASVGQTRTITVSIKNNRYPETVRIELYRSVAGGGFEPVGVSIQFVPVRSGNRTSQFTFKYTFSPQDAQVGKVTFRAVVFIENANDAFPADNDAISVPPTKVTR